MVMRLRGFVPLHSIYSRSRPITAILVGCKGLERRGYASLLLNRLREEHAEQGLSFLLESVGATVNGVGGLYDWSGPGMVLFFWRLGIGISV